MIVKFKFNLRILQIRNSMRYVLTITIFIFSAHSHYISDQEYISPHILKSIIASYNFDEDLTKDSTGLFNGTIIGNGAQRVEGILGSALYFDGKCSKFVVDAFKDYDWGQEITVSLFIKRIGSENY